MARTGTNKKYSIIILVIAILAFAAVFLFKKKDKAANDQAATHVPFTEEENHVVLPTDVKEMTLSDNTKVFYVDGSVIDTVKNFSDKRELSVDGDVYFEVPDAGKPLELRSKLLLLTVRGKAGFRIVSYKEEDGAEVQVIYGDIVAKKSYPSDFPEPDTLRDNNLLMINISIDLMEKEKMSMAKLNWWRDSLFQARNLPVDK